MTRELLRLGNSIVSKEVQPSKAYSKLVRKGVYKLDKSNYFKDLQPVNKDSIV